MIFVTGATGFVGRRTIRKLLEIVDRKDVLCLVYDQADNELERSGRANLDQLGVKYIPVDLATGRGMENLPKSPDQVIHLASNTTTGDRDHSINDVGARNLIEAIRPLKAGFHFVFTSTISVSDHRRDPESPCTEDSELLRPFSEYGRKKLLTEQYLIRICQEEKIALSILRLSGIYGNGPKPGGLFDSLVVMARQNSILCRFDFPGRISAGYVDDVAAALVNMAQSPAALGSVELHVFAPESPSVSEMSEAIHQGLGKAYRPIRLPGWFWSTCKAGSRILYLLEPVIPHALYNRLWQLTLLMNNGYNNQPRRLASRFPTLQFTKFRDGVREMCQ